MMTQSYAVPLTMVKTGTTVTLTSIQGGHRVRRRLAELGLTVGMPLRVVRGDQRGQIILAVKDDARLAIGRGIAHKIMVSPREDII